MPILLLYNVCFCVNQWNWLKWCDMNSSDLTQAVFSLTLSEVDERPCYCVTPHPPRFFISPTCSDSLSSPTSSLPHSLVSARLMKTSRPIKRSRQGQAQGSANRLSTVNQEQTPPSKQGILGSPPVWVKQSSRGQRQWVERKAGLLS